MTHLTCALKRSARRSLRRATAPRRHHAAAATSTAAPPAVDPFTLMLYAYAVGSMAILLL